MPRYASHREPVPEEDGEEGSSAASCGGGGARAEEGGGEYGREAVPSGMFRVPEGSYIGISHTLPHRDEGVREGRAPAKQDCGRG